MDPRALVTLIKASALVHYAPEESSPLRDEDIALERPKNRDHGDWSTSIALKLAAPAGLTPLELATQIAAELLTDQGIAKAEVAGPGFINITLEAGSAGELVKTIVEAGENFGTGSELASHTINVEFVSANPTGPLHIGHTRWAALGDSLVRVLRAAGATVTAEFYINDEGAQLELFGLSIIAAAEGTPAPEGGYQGEYIAQLASRVIERHPDLLELAEPLRTDTARDEAYALQLADIRESLTRFNVNFDVWFSERTLHTPGAQGLSPIEESIERLRAGGHVFEEEGALWVRTTHFGDDKDRVIRKANGSYTYFAADAAYYLSKSDRGFPTKIYLLGADHHGYINRLKAIAGAAGDNPEESVEILIGQLVSINGAKLSKRAGNIVELDDLQAWLGTDALRYSLGRYPADSPLALDSEILTKRSNDNPVFYVQYAHARTHQVARNAAAGGVTRDSFEPGTLTHDTEAALVAVLGDFPRVVSQAASFREPHRVARYLEEVAASYHRWYDNCRVTPQGDDPMEALHQTRLWLNDAAGVVLRNGLGMLGVSAPERM